MARRRLATLAIAVMVCAGLAGCGRSGSGDASRATTTGICAKSTPTKKCLAGQQVTAGGFLTNTVWHPAPIKSADAAVPATIACNALYKLAQAWRTTTRTPRGLVTNMAAAGAAAANANPRMYSEVAQTSAALAQLVKSTPSNRRALLLNGADVAAMQQACLAVPLQNVYLTLPTY
jgi:hypothetical protein